MISPKFEISHPKAEESREIAKIHFSLIPGSQLSNLGLDFLDKCYYRKMIEDDEFVCLVAKFNGVITGFISGVLNEERIFLRLVIKNIWYFFFNVLRLLFTSSLSIGYLSSALKRVLSQDKNFRHLKAKLLSLAVLPEYRSREFRNKHGIHIAKDLFYAWVQLLREKGVEEFKFVTPKSKSSVIGLYKMFRVPIVGETHIPEGEAWVYIGNTRFITENYFEKLERH